MCSSSRKERREILLVAVSPYETKAAEEILGAPLQKKPHQLAANVTVGNLLCEQLDYHIVYSDE